MTTLNTIIEEEKKKLQKIECLVEDNVLEDFLATAMQRAYKQALDGVIQKATLKENPIEDNGELIDGSYYVIYKGYLDQLKK